MIPIAFTIGIVVFGPAVLLNVSDSSEGKSSLQSLGHRLSVVCLLGLIGLAGPAVGSTVFYVSNNGPANSVDNISDTGVVTLNSNGYSGPGGLALDPTGSFLYVTDFNNGNGQTVSRVAATGGSPTTFITAAAGLHAPVAVTTDSAGNLFIVDSGNLRVSEFDSSGNIININFITGLINPIRGVAVDGSGNVFVTDGSTFREYSSAGGNVPTFTVSGFSLAFGIAFGTGGNAGFAFVSDTSANSVLKVNLSDGTKTQYNASGVGLSAPTGITFDNLGNLFVANDANNTISEISPAGVVSTFATTGLSFSGPVGIVFAEVPEPSSLLLSALGIGTVMAALSRRRQAQISAERSARLQQ